MADNQLKLGLARLMSELRGDFKFDVATKSWLITFGDKTVIAPEGAVLASLTRSVAVNGKPAAKAHPVRKAA